MAALSDNDALVELTALPPPTIAATEELDLVVATPETSPVILFAIGSIEATS